jgi:predicted enzyme related to lactoylglutathione lyase
MTERTAFPAGVPCWVDTWQPDAATAATFYAALMGWETEATPTADAAPQYLMCRLDGRDVAAIGDGAGVAPDEGAARGAPAPAWTTYVRVASVDDTVAEARAAGGRVVTGPADSLDGGRIAILADPVGAVLGVWEPGAHGGAELVNAPGAWAMSVLLTDDPHAAKPFYAATFGWRGDPFPLGDAEGTLFRLDGYVGGTPHQPVPRDVVAVMAPAFGRPAGWVVGFWVDDADATAARAAELGGTVLAGPFDTPISRDAVIADPAGAVFTVTTVPPAAR